MILVRAAPAHALALRTFTCAAPTAWFEVEVEQYVRGQLAEEVELARLPGSVLLAMEGLEITAVSAHYARIYSGPRDDPPVTASYVQVLAVSAPWQGREVPELGRLSTFFVNATLHDCLACPDRAPVVTAMVAVENHRARRALVRAGFEEDEAAEVHRDGTGTARQYIWTDWR